MRLFADPLHDQFASLATGWVTSGAADYGEVVAIAEAFPDGGDDAAYYEAWSAAAGRHVERADEALASGRELTAQGHLFRASGEARPVVIVSNGYDGTLPETHFGIGKAAAERGYHAVLFDGPGQGALLVRDGISLVADWERVVGAVVDAIVDRGDVDRDRIALNGWSLGGHLAPRAATCWRRSGATAVSSGRSSSAASGSTGR